jgi:hypothetical protein
MGIMIGFTVHFITFGFSHPISQSISSFFDS